ncbi:MAG: PhzF family phenazine biosynthesis protein [Anaerolineaceae bacterium]|jgi:PhzF family phenazine biosynthesis protein|nr:PhzF family phenazine biosynthesis protein [Anaerolineaceae bacterium]
MNLPIYQVDAFTRRPFSGNPAAVCLLTRPLPDETMLAVAAEMNLSETAFLLPEGEGYRLRWMTPQVEVKLCGHATLASAHVLWETGRLAPDQTAHFATLSGPLHAARRGEWIELDFPTRDAGPVAPLPGLAEALGVEIVHYACGENIYLVEVEDEDSVRRAQPDFARLKALGLRSVILTSRASGGDYDFVSRYFAPNVGINEDPVTGSSHCRLAPYWAGKLGQTRLRARQLSARGGDLQVRLEGDRVALCGQAVTVLRGELSLAEA